MTLGGFLAQLGMRPYTVFRIFKYSVYALLCYNVLLWFYEDHQAAAATFGDTVTWRNVVEAYSATIDTLAWVILLLLFELETAVIPDERLSGSGKWTLTGIRSVSYFFIVYAAYGYWVKYQLVTDLTPFSIVDVCGLIGSSFSYVATLDDYLPIDSVSCAAMQGQTLVRISGTEIIGTQGALADAIRLAVVDVVNAADWLLVVILLEVEVFLQLRSLLTTRLMLIMKVLKSILYLVLLGAAVYWGIEGTFLDFWDAFLWLVAFAFIEMNIFEWHEEAEQAAARHTQVTA